MALFLLLVLLLFPLAFSSNPLIYHYCGNNSSTTSPNPLQSNINFVLSDLITRTPPSGFAISSHGDGTTTLYGLTRCRGDVPADVCSTCITEAAKQLPSLCPNSTDARIWYDYCFLRYDAKNFIGKVDTSNGLILYNVENAKDPVRFEGAVKELMGGVEEAAVGSDERYGWGTRGFTKKVSIRGMEQCTRDLSAGSCRECLDSALGLFPDYCGYHQGCQVLYSSCVVRYEIYDFRYKGDGSGDGKGGLEQRMIAV
ncbi:cysteine-rich repeat secretory protein 55-like [Phalaenopsis equestris]|uniref:cysteine-rich repeat secretory protein 55-like n=1 Tax=Phalaenopsis equestris TaxID=78828 RepID=UPI0009E639A8|nr:cysteine-rich repeat secretory protein 55-like [Phalaenopsis equestris]